MFNLVNLVASITTVVLSVTIHGTVASKSSSENMYVVPPDCSGNDNADIDGRTIGLQTSAAQVTYCGYSFWPRDCWSYCKDGKPIDQPPPDPYDPWRHDPWCWVDKAIKCEKQGDCDQIDPQCYNGCS